MRMTTDEIKVVTFVLAALVVGAAAKNYRGTHPEPIKVKPVPGRVTPRPWLQK